MHQMTHEMQFDIEHTIPGSPEPEITICRVYGKDIEFANVKLQIAEDLEIHPDATDDGVEFLITAMVGGDEYGVVRTDMTADQIREAVYAASEMYAWYCYEEKIYAHKFGGYDDYDF